MDTVVGIFDSQADGQRAFDGLLDHGFTAEQLTLVSPGSGEIESIPTTKGEASRVGKTLGGVVGSAMGGAGGGLMGSVVASFFAPGIGPIMVVGFAAAAIAAVGGAVVGVEVGGGLERILSAGLPKNELFFCEEALRNGRTVLVGLSDDEAQLEAAHQLLAREGAEALEATREKWWAALRDAKRAEYGIPAPGSAHESNFRLGFEAALEPGVRGKRYDEAHDALKTQHPRVFEEDAFRQGFKSGHAYYQSLESPRDKG